MMVVSQRPAMTQEDLTQIRAIVREEITAAIAASEERTAAAIAASEERTTAAIAASEERMIVRQEGMLQTIALEFTELRKEMDRRFDLVDRRFDSVDRRLERVENQNNALVIQNAGMSKSLSEAERLDTATFATLSAQQKAIDDLYQQIAELKRQRSQPPQ